MQKEQSEYNQRGDYHRNLDPRWSYYPTYLAKKKWVLELLKKEPKEAKILDLGAGEGVFLEELRKSGFAEAIGLDLNYSSELVRQGNVLATGLPDSAFDIILFLDILEHLNFSEQEKALLEAKRLLKDNGKLIISVPNLAHFYSRLKFLLQGELGRTANIKKHPGDRPIKEYIDLLKQSGFLIEKRKGIFPTLPFLFNLITAFPSKTLWLYNFLNHLAPLPNFCFLNIFICRKK